MGEALGRILFREVGVERISADFLLGILKKRGKP
jgi:hypothetical protein